MRVIGQVVTVRLEAMKVGVALPELGDGAPAATGRGYTQADIVAAQVHVAEVKPVDGWR